MINIEEPLELVNYLRGRGAIGKEERPAVQNLVGGVSNRTVKVTRSTGEAWVLKQGLPKLRVRTDWFCSPERVHREAAGMRLLAKLTPPGSIPALVFEDRENHLLAMEAVPDPHENWKQMLLAGDLANRHVLQFARLLATIHRRAAELEGIRGEFGDLSFFEALRLEPYYRYTANRIPETADFFDALVEDNRNVRVTLVHGDFSPKNILIYRDDLILLDHEVIHFGDPAFDLGFAMTHLLSKANHLKSHRTAFLQAALFLWQTYWSEVDSGSWTEGLEVRAVRNTLGCMLARVAGRSPLEYLSDSERDRQQRIVVAMLLNPSVEMEDLISQFADNLKDYA